MKLDAVAADGIPPGDADAGEVFSLFVGRDGVAEKVALALRFSAGGEGAEPVHADEIFTSALPADGDFFADDLNVVDPGH